MPLPRFYIPQPLNAPLRLALPAAAAHHAARVLRLRVGDALIVFNGNGGEYAAHILAMGKQDVTIEIERHDPIERESPLDVILVQALSAAERMDFSIQKAVELGVRQIIPVQSERCVVRLHGERAAKRVQHWQQIAVSACEQGGRNRVPEIKPIISLAAWLATSMPEWERWVLLPEAEKALSEMPRPHKPLAVLVGPEGGFTDAEAAAAQQAWHQSVRLGPRILRTETVAPTALAAMQVLWGDF
mgnify:CR=1 FL=1